jgi:hypothetical protein
LFQSSFLITSKPSGSVPICGNSGR